MWNKRCFPEWKQKRPQWWSSEDSPKNVDSVKIESDEVTEMIRKPLYECPVCEGFGSYEGCTVLKHIHKVHPDCPDAQPMSNLERYADEIRDLQNRCFPNRPMKLVAQSDRQRHVYHRHLQRTRIFECPLCSFASNYDVHRREIDQLNEECFPGWQHRRKPFWWLDNDDKKIEVCDGRRSSYTLLLDCFSVSLHTLSVFHVFAEKNLL
ncbi:unnamed protein product [Nippostrongylus brasiliensis]|uniref:C2H2-type domain-containing protein n=1 Tax=Nippostrongylus brasiliensis TaxID=27835 RepID=A0A0N4YVY0_NIPBR|nr:unnamed protein product [Nippostrongylus brasiliensis]